MGWYGAGMGWAMMISSSVLGLALIGLVVWAVVRITSTAQPDRSSSSGAREILDRRFAAGEIDVEAYRTALRELSTPAGR